MDFDVWELGDDDVRRLRALNALFATTSGAAEDAAAPPSDAYLEGLLLDAGFIALAALKGREVIGGLVAYVLRKIEQERSEVYLYDLAVAPPYRRRGIATALVARLQEIAAERRAHVVFVQADFTDPPAIALYEKLGRREDVVQFDIPVV